MGCNHPQRTVFNDDIFKKEATLPLFFALGGTSPETHGLREVPAHGEIRLLNLLALAALDEEVVVDDPDDPR